MKTLIITFLALLALPKMAIGDILKIETNTWDNRIPLTWICTLEKIDADSKIAYFTYQNNDKTERFEVHVTRIYSLTLDNQNRVNLQFPKTMTDLKTKLPINPHATPNLEVSNKTGISGDIPEKVRFKLSNDNLILFMNGVIKKADIETILLEVLNKREKDSTKPTSSEVEIPRGELLKWIR